MDWRTSLTCGSSSGSSNLSPLPSHTIEHRTKTSIYDGVQDAFHHISVPLAGVLPITHVASLIHDAPDGPRWNVPLLTLLWPPDVVQCICNIPLGGADIRCWGEEPDLYLRSTPNAVCTDKQRIPKTIYLAIANSLAEFGPLCQHP